MLTPGQDQRIDLIDRIYCHLPNPHNTASSGSPVFGSEVLHGRGWKKSARQHAESAVRLDRVEGRPRVSDHFDATFNVGESQDITGVDDRLPLDFADLRQCQPA